MVDVAGDTDRLPKARVISCSLRCCPRAGVVGRRIARVVFAMLAVLLLPGDALQFWLSYHRLDVSSWRCSHALRVSPVTACVFPQIASAWSFAQLSWFV